MSERSPLIYRFLVGAVRLLLRLFFREIAVEGTERIPKNTGGLMVAWHPNGLIDPALILSYFPGRIVFGARHGLFRLPILGRLLRELGTVPIFRTMDLSGMSRAEQMTANLESLNSLAQELADGSFSGLFPEGLSHDQSHLSEVKTGAARLYFHARELAPEDAPPPVIIPVGLHYDRKNIFRSRVLVSFYKPLQLTPDLDVRPSDNDTRAEEKARLRGLTKIIRETLVEIVGATDDWDLHHLMHRVRKLMRAERADRAHADPDPPSISEWELGYARIWYGYRELIRSKPREMEILRRDVSYYDRNLRALGLEDYELSHDPRGASPLRIAMLVLQLVIVYLFIPTILLAGLAINVLPYLALKVLDRKMAKDEKDSASIKVLGGAVLFPLTWGIAAFLATRGMLRLHLLFPSVPEIPGFVAITTIILGIVSGLLALRYMEMATETFRAVRVRMARSRSKKTIDLLRQNRAALYERFARLEEGLDLPGEVAPDGRIVESGNPDSL